jgi:hypothetical protein
MLEINYKFQFSIRYRDIAERRQLASEKMPGIQIVTISLSLEVGYSDRMVQFSFGFGATRSRHGCSRDHRKKI